AGLDAQFVGLDAGVVLDDARFFAGAANDLAFVEHVVGTLLRVGDDVVRAVLGVGKALGNFLLGLLQGGVGAHLGAGDAVHGRSLGVVHDARALVVHLHAVLHRVGEVFLHIVDDAQALIGIDDLFIRQRHIGA